MVKSIIRKILGVILSLSISALLTYLYLIRYVDLPTFIGAFVGITLIGAFVSGLMSNYIKVIVRKTKDIVSKNIKRKTLGVISGVFIPVLLISILTILMPRYTYSIFWGIIFIGAFVAGFLSKDIKVGFLSGVLTPFIPFLLAYKGYIYLGFGLPPTSILIVGLAAGAVGVIGVFYTREKMHILYELVADKYTRRKEEITVQEPRKILEVRPTPLVIEEPVEISSGFEPYGEYLKIGIKIVNKSNMAILNSSITLDSVPDALSFAEPDRAYLVLDDIMPNEFQSAIYKLKPTRCVDGDIRGTFNYFDVGGQRHSLEIPSIHVRNICPFLTSEGVVAADWMDMLESGLLDSKSEYFEFKSSPRIAFGLAENRVRHLKLVERDERVIDDVYCGYCCYFGNAKYGGYYFATTILVSGSETQGRLTLTVYSNHSDIFTGYFHEVLEDVRKHIETSQGISVITGECPECGGKLDPSQTDEKGIIKCSHCRCLNVIPLWMRIK